MNEVAKTSRFVIYDDVLPTDDFGKLMAFVSNEPFMYAHRNKWESVWKATDGNVMRTQGLYTENFPTDTPWDRIYEKFLEVAVTNPDLCGPTPEVWSRMTVSSYIYPKGTRISWHGDGGEYSSALTYYLHPRWSPHWGGELLVANTPPQNLMPKLDYEVSGAIDHSQMDAWINAYGTGHMIIPKPNRLVLMKAGTAHMVNRVDEAAGDNLRWSIVGFTMISPTAKEQCVQVVRPTPQVAGGACKALPQAA